jgi:hypothetical protein
MVRWEAALAALRGGHLSEAAAALQVLATEDPEDGLAAFYVERCDALERQVSGVPDEVDRFGAR